MGRGFRQLRALLLKNLTLKRRRWISSLVEIALPMFVIFVMMYMHSQFEPIQTPANLHLDKAYNSTAASHNFPHLKLALQQGDGKIAIVPKVGNEDIADYLTAAGFEDRIMFFANNNELDDHVRQFDYGRESYPYIHAAIVKNAGEANVNDFLSDPAPVFDYSIRMNASQSIGVDYQTVPDTRMPALRPIQKGYEGAEANRYMHKGFIEIQQMISYLALHNTGSVVLQTDVNGKITPDSVAASNVFFNFIPFPTPSFIFDDFSRQVGGYLGIFFTLTFMWPITRIVSGIVEEKELRIKEGMKMMGLRDAPLILSWLITHVIMFIFTCFLIVVVSCTTLYKFSNSLLIFVYFYSFCIAVYGFSYLMSVLFDRARVASTFSSIIFLGAFFVIYAVEGAEVAREVKQMACLSPAVCLALGATTISKLESAQVGLTFSTLSTEIDNFTYMDSITLMIFDGFLMFFLGLYLEQVLPSQYGLHRPWYFLCTRSFWFGSQKIQENDDNASTSLLSTEDDITRLNEYYTKTEDPDKSLQGNELVRVRHLRKVFPLANAVSSESICTKIQRSLCGFSFCPAFIRPSKDSSAALSDDINHDDQNTGDKFVAVKDLSIDMYKDQIFTLLGHNGAGKTTTINMLTGLYAPTSGDARVIDYTITSGMGAIRHNMGVCPQHDILYPYLTVREHLELYAELKNINTKTRNIEIDEMIDAVGLGVEGDNKANSLAGSLSGGQMRKLSVGIALLGGSRIVYLDEPSSGMDVASQRHIWDLLMKAKKDRVIVLTTHFMEEAEIGDRIAIMAGGKLQCIGSSLFLKNSYGVGYTLTISKNTQSKTADPKAIVHFLRDNYSFAELLSDAGGEVSFRLPFSHTDQFADMFEALEQNQKQLGLTTFGVSVTTLTEVFLKVGHGHVEEKEDSAPDALVGNSSLNSAHATPAISSASHMDLEEDEKDEVNMFDGINPEDQRLGSVERLKLHVKALFMKRWNNSKRDKNQWFWQILYPGLILTLSLISQKSQGDPKYPTRSMTSQTYAASNPMPFPNVNGEPYPGLLMENLNYQNVGFTPLPVSDADFTIDYTEGEKITPHIFSSFLTIDLDRHEYPRYNAVLFDELEGLPLFEDNLPTKLVSNVYFNTTAADALPLSFNYFVNGLMSAHHTFAGKTGPAPKITIVNEPFDRTNSELVLSSASAATSLALAFAFVPATFAAFVVKEREDKGKHLQLISGVTPLAYWLSTLLWDLANYVAPFLMGMFLLAVFDIKAAFGSATLVTVLNFWLFCLSVAPFVYCLTFFFENHSAAQNMTLMINFFLSVMLIIVCLVMDISESTRDFNYYLRFIYRLLPPFCFVETFLNVFVLDSPTIYDGSYSPWSFKVAGWPLTYMVFNFFFYTVILFAIEHYTSTSGGAGFIKSMINMFRPEPATTDGIAYSYSQVDGTEFYNADPNEDSDVTDERLRIQGGMCNDSMVVISGLGKTYPSRMNRPPFTAVHNLYYSVEAGECFGFLGANGAGKTTTIKMLTGDETPSKGTARLGGRDIIQEPYEVRQLIGYCPQFDALIPLMTAREHLEMYARIKCIPEKIIPVFISRMLSKLGLEHLADRPAGTYSGGNKRKLSVGIALIGNPAIVFLDEPSTGMDPQARRFMWKLISSTMVGRSVILTTHSMEECEALCNRIGIMTKGKLRCIGNSQHLKSKFGQGFKLIVKTLDGCVESSTKRILERFPGSVCFEAHGTNLKFKVPKNVMSLADIFRTLEGDKKEVGIATYSVSDTDLEQIFVNFVKEGETLEHSTAIPVHN